MVKVSVTSTKFTQLLTLTERKAAAQRSRTAALWSPGQDLNHTCQVQYSQVQLLLNSDGPVLLQHVQGGSIAETFLPGPCSKDHVQC